MIISERKRPVKLLSPFGPGGFTDFIVENMIPRFSELLGSEIRVDYKPGRPGGCLAPRIAAKAAPDGKTLLVGTVGNTALLPAIYPNYGINPLTDLTPISLLVQAADILVARPDLPVNDLDGLIALAKQEPEGLTYNPIASGSIHYLEFLMLMNESNIKLSSPVFSNNPNEAPYRAVAEGDVDLLISTPARTFPRLRTGEMKGIALIARERSVGAPGLPTFPELGIQSLHTGSWTGLFGPPGMSKELVREIADAVRDALYTTEGLGETLGQRGMTLEVSESPEAFRAYLETEMVRLAKEVSITDMPFVEED